MRMTIFQQLSYREKMYNRALGAINSETKKLNTPSEARHFADKALRKKIADYIPDADLTDNYNE